MWPWLTCTLIYSRLRNLTLTFIWRIGTLRISITCEESLKSRKTKIPKFKNKTLRKSKSTWKGQLEKLYLFHLTSFYRTLVHICDQCYSMKILDNAYYNQKIFMMITEVSITAGYQRLPAVYRCLYSIRFQGKGTFWLLPWSQPPSHWHLLMDNVIENPWWKYQYSVFWCFLENRSHNYLMILCWKIHVIIS